MMVPSMMKLHIGFSYRWVQVSVVFDISLKGGIISKQQLSKQ